VTPRLLSTTALVLALGIPSHAAAAPPSRDPLKSTLDRIVNRPAFAHALWGIQVRDLGRHAPLYSVNEGSEPDARVDAQARHHGRSPRRLWPDRHPHHHVETAARLDGAGRILGDVLPRRARRSDDLGQLR